MAYIQNNKHTPSRTVRLPETAALAVLALTLPGMALTAFVAIALLTLVARAGARATTDTLR